MNLQGAWTELIAHDSHSHAEIYRRVFDAGSQRLFAGSSVRPLGAADTVTGSPDVRFGTIVRRVENGHPERSTGAAGIFDCRLIGTGVFHLGVVLADTDDWGNGLGMDAMTALLRYLFHTENCRTFEMFAGVHNSNTVRILANGMVTPEAVWRHAISDGPVLRDLVVGSLTAEDFAAAGYVPSGATPRDPAPTDELWQSVRSRMLQEAAS